jgi:hypothetical protein
MLAQAGQRPYEDEGPLPMPSCKSAEQGQIELSFDPSDIPDTRMRDGFQVGRLTM